MNLVNLQLDFYRRFNDAAAHLTFAKSGTLCDLLGLPELNGSKSLTCALSMGVTVAARRLDSGFISLQSTDSNTCTRYSLNDLFHGENKPERDILSLFQRTGFNGAEVLYDSDIAPGYSTEPPLRAALINTIFKMNNTEPPKAEDTAFLCGAPHESQYYTALLSAKPGWCTYMNGQTLRNYPLPMKGLLILSVHVRRGTRFPRVNTLEKELRRLRNSHPMVFSYGDITPDMVNTVEYNYLPYIASENVRIDEACNALKNCSITEFAKIVNDSARATAEYLNTSEEQNFLTRIAPNIEGCLCAHAAANGIYSIVEAELTDYIIGKISDKFEDCFGYKPQFAVTKAS